ncbi:MULTISPECIES: hypothetical protein [Caproicibacterium]|uniref:Uncharacterized protein n=2 Tax=Caproicibacterium TaxID=2834348 RepID=A0A7G9WJQ2_9FIRM|nr:MULTISPECIES: hypothetical protein [Caproicibacterium]QNO18914.1 hypothetical protein H6X83_04605 [Caproicibacterium amylolyticum]WOC32908.1 hypothetical protein PXC00_03255 [Caproicibacterium argilliputei]
MSEELKPCQLSPERAIEILWGEAARNQQPLHCTRKELCDAVEMAEESITRAQQPNEPLTVGELRKMDGQPVWVKAVDPNDSDTNYWAIVSANMHYSHKSGGVISTSTDGVAVVAIAYFEDYGKSWLAYRRPPEAGEKG